MIGEVQLYIYYPTGNYWVEQVACPKCGFMMQKREGVHRKKCLYCQMGIRRRKRR